MDWVEIPNDTLDTTSIEDCQVGIGGHRWLLSLEESRPCLRLAEGEICPPARPSDSQCGETVCESVVSEASHPDMGQIQMADLPVKIEWESNCRAFGETHINGPCDHDYWWNVVPTPQDDDKLLNDLKEGIQQAAEGKTEQMDFSQYLDDEID